jgi:uncharacterized membrane protein
MIRTLVGGLLGGLALYLVGFIFWGTPLSGLAFGHVDEAQGLAVHQALASSLGAVGTGSYLVPDPGTPAGTALFGQGPIAMVHFVAQGFPVVDGPSLLLGLILAFIAGIIIAVALDAVPAPNRLRVGLLFSVSITSYLDLGQPIFNHYGWGYFVYLFLGDLLGFAACVAVISWMLARPSAQQRQEAHG